MKEHPATVPEAQLLRECAVTRTRRSGPGGQHRNKVETAIVITHTPTGTRAEANERRSQEQNRQVAVFRLRINLALAIRTSSVDNTVPSELWQGRRSGTRIQINPTHDDFPALLAEAFNFIVDADYDVAVAAERLGISTSQLVKFLKIDDRALQAVNAIRESHGQHILR